MPREIRRLRHPKTGDVVEGVVVPIEHEENKPVHIRLSDGALIRIKVDIAEVSCVPEEFDADGNPLYFVKTGTLITILEPPRAHSE